MGRDDAYRGFEVWFNDVKMALKMYWVLGLVMGVVHLVLFALVARAWLGEVDALILLHWVVARFHALSNPGHPLTFPYGGQAYAMSASQLPGSAARRSSVATSSPECVSQTRTNGSSGAADATRAPLFEIARW